MFSWRLRYRDSRTRRIIDAIQELQGDAGLPVSAERVAAHLDDPSIPAGTVRRLMQEAGDRDDLDVSILSFHGPGGGYLIADGPEREPDLIDFKRLRLRVTLTILRRTRNRAVVPFVRQFVEPVDPVRAQSIIGNLDTVITELAALV